MGAVSFKRMVGVAAAAAIVAFGFAGCGDDNGVKPNGGGGDVRDNRLVTGTGEAWILDDGYDDEGIVFRANGDVINIYHQSGNNWYGYDDGIYKWSTSGSELRRIYDDIHIDYTVSGNELILDGDEIFTKISGITPIMLGTRPNVSSAGSRDNRLVTGAGEAWVDCYYYDWNDEERCFGIALYSDGVAASIYKDSDFGGAWHGTYCVDFTLNGSTSWSTSGNKISLTFTIAEKYAISNDTLTTTIKYYSFGEEDEWETSDNIYIKKSGLTITVRDYDDNGYYKRPKSGKRKTVSILNQKRLAPQLRRAVTGS